MFLFTFWHHFLCDLFHFEQSIQNHLLYKRSQHKKVNDHASFFCVPLDKIQLMGHLDCAWVDLNLKSNTSEGYGINLSDKLA